MIIIIVLAILSGLGKAVRDTIDHHWERSIFSRIKSEFWLKWLRSNWQDKPKHPIWFLWDGWHFFDSLSYASLLPEIRFCSEYWEIAVIISARWFMFNILYHKILLIEGSKEC